MQAPVTYTENIVIFYVRVYRMVALSTVTRKETIVAVTLWVLF